MNKVMMPQLVISKTGQFFPTEEKQPGFRLRSPLSSLKEPWPLNPQTVFSITQLGQSIGL
jgi:hypothetical protein